MMKPIYGQTSYDRPHDETYIWTNFVP